MTTHGVSAGPSGEQPLPGRPEASRRLAMWASAAAGALGLVGVAVARVQLSTRPPCPPGYVRLVDLSRLSVEVPGAVVVTAGCLWLWSRRPGPHLPAAVVAVLLVGLVLLVDVSVALLLGDQWGSQFDPTCWTF